MDQFSQSSHLCVQFVLAADQASILLPPVCPTSYSHVLAALDPKFKNVNFAICRAFCESEIEDTSPITTVFVQLSVKIERAARRRWDVLARISSAAAAAGHLLPLHAKLLLIAPPGGCFLYFCRPSNAISVSINYTYLGRLCLPAGPTIPRSEALLTRKHSRPTVQRILTTLTNDMGPK